MKRYIISIGVLIAILVSTVSYAKNIESSKELREGLFQKKSLYFEKSSQIDSNNYTKTLKSLYESEETFSIQDAIVTVGDTFIFKPTLYTEYSGPEYANDALMAPGFDIEIDGRTDIEDITAFLSSLPLESQLTSFINANFIEDDALIKKYGLDFYLTSLMAGMVKYPDFGSLISVSIKALKKHPDTRVLPFIEKFMNDFNPPAELYEELIKLRKFIINEKLYPQIYGRPEDCNLLYNTAKIIAQSNKKDEIRWAMASLGQMNCKESISLLFYIKNLAYINVGENLFNNEQYFSWDRENLRFSIDLKTKTEFNNDIFEAYQTALASGLKLSDALALLAKKNKIIAVGADSIYFEYIFRIPFSSEWTLTGTELKSLVNNSLLASSGYLLKKSKGIYRIAKANL